MKNAKNINFWKNAFNKSNARDLKICKDLNLLLCAVGERTSKLSQLFRIKLTCKYLFNNADDGSLSISDMEKALKASLSASKMTFDENQVQDLVVALWEDGGLDSPSDTMDSGMDHPGLFRKKQDWKKFSAQTSGLQKKIQFLTIGKFLKIEKFPIFLKFSEISRYFKIIKKIFIIFETLKNIS